MNTDATNSNRSRASRWSRTIRIAAFWTKLIAQPLLAVVFVVGMAWWFGYLQRNHHWFDDAITSVDQTAPDEDAQYACSMLCVFVKAPGRCPVCGMELQKIETQGDPKDIYGVTVDPAARRLSNIKTVAALNLPVSKSVEALGRIAYDETSMATVSAYVDGRIENLFVDFTGETIQKGDELAVLYSPDLYVDQASLLQARSALDSDSSNPRVQQANRRLYRSARQRLVEQGIPEAQVEMIESRGTPNTRIKVYAPMAGTVIEKFVDEGKYIKTGQPIFRIADLSTVWMMLEMYPEDTSNLELGQSVSVEIQSRPGHSFLGQISFIDPVIDPQTQTVNVRVALSNEAGLLKIGDLGKAVVQSNRRPPDQWVVVPRESVLRNGANSVVYVETEPGRFEFRQVLVGDVMGDQIAIADGIKPGEQVVASGAFMLDSTFNIQGKVSLIDPTRAGSLRPHASLPNDAEALEIAAAFSGLSMNDRELAQSQVICPVTEMKLGTQGMGAPIRIELPERDVMICCAGCETRLRENPDRFFRILDNYRSEKWSPSTSSSNADDHSLPKLAPPRTDLPGLHTPRSDPGESGPLTTESPRPESRQSDLPQMDLPQMELPQMELPRKEPSR